MERFISKLWCFVFIGIIVLIPASYPLIKPYINTENYENRELAAFPTIENTEWYKFPSAIDDYISDNFPYKNQMVLANSLTDYCVFDDNPSPDTIKGSDGWLFYKGENDNALLQYKGLSKYTDDELADIADSLASLRDYLNERDCRFILYIVPNKERVYSEYMPDNIKVYDDECNTDQLISYLEENTDIDVVWAYTSLMEYKEKHPDMPLYYHLDTHWNGLGAYIGAMSLCDEIGVKLQEPSDASFEKTDNSSYDLADFSGLRLVLEGKDTDYEPLNMKDDYEIELDEIDGSFKYHNTSKDDTRLMVCRDSFMIGMRRYIGNTFNESYMPHRNIFDMGMIDEFSPDVFVYEVVERNIDRLSELKP